VKNFPWQKTNKRISYMNWKRWTLDDFLRRLLTAGSIERNVIKLTSKYAVFMSFLVLSGSVETQLRWSGTVADPEIVGGGCGRVAGGHEPSGRRQRWGEVWGGGIPLPTGDGSGKGAVPHPQNFFFILDLKMASFPSPGSATEVVFLLTLQ